MADTVLATQGLYKQFDALQASKDVSLDVKSGEIHALIGPNGAGKSTLIQQIAGALQPDAGEVVLNNETVTRLDVAGRAQRGLARTFQISALAMEDTVLQNVLLGAVGAQQRAFRLFESVKRDRSINATAEQALSRVGLLEYSTMHTYALSHGQRRLLEIAIALTLNPTVFVMDEPMAGLGTEGSRTMIEFLSELRFEAPILMVEHDMDAVFALADRISVLEYGEIIATGSVEEIKRDPAVQRAYLGAVT